VEAISTFAPGLIALFKTAINPIEGVRYKLQMMGIPWGELPSFFCDNESVVKNVSAPESTLKKHLQRSVTTGRAKFVLLDLCIAHEDGDTNISDILTKLMPGPRMSDLLEGVLW
jgi:hypothetical protein